MVVVLDGLEVLQRPSEDADAGQLDDRELLTLLDGLTDPASHRYPGLVVLASRVPLHDLDDRLGSTLRSIDLEPPDGPEAEALLRHLGVSEAALCQRLASGARASLLALQLGAAIGQRASRQDAESSLAMLLGPLDPAAEPSPVDLHAAIQSYQHLLSIPERQVLAALAFLPEPIPPALLPELIRRLGIPSVFPGSNLDEAKGSNLGAVQAALNTLYRDGVVMRVATGGPLAAELASSVDWERSHRRQSRSNHPPKGARAAGAFMCHDVVAETLRGLVLQVSSEPGRAAAELLARGYPVMSRDELRWLVHSVQYSLEVGDLRGAYDRRLHDAGGGRAFWTWEMHDLGLACALAFIGDDARAERCATIMPQRNVGVLASQAGQHAQQLGHLRQSMEFLDRAMRWTVRAGASKNASINLQNQVSIQVELGTLAEAEKNAQSAIEYAEAIRSWSEQSDSHAVHALVLATYGRLAEAQQAFARGDQLEARDSIVEGLSGSEGLRLVDLLLRAGAHGLVQLRLDHGRRLAEDASHLKAPQVRAAIGDAQFALATGLLDRARTALNQAHSMLNRHIMPLEAAWLELAKAELAAQEERFNEALRLAEYIQRLADARQMRLIQIDALVMMARLRWQRAVRNGDALYLDTVSLWRAYDIADVAVSLSAQAGYAWGERAAHRIAEALSTALDLPNSPARHQHRARDLDAVLVVPMEWAQRNP